MNENALHSLSELLEEELERQENVKAICLAQGDAARAHDTEALEARTLALNLLLREAAHAEGARLKLVREIVATHRLPVEEQTLSGLIAAAPAPYSERLRHVQQRLQQVLHDTRVAVRENNRIMRRSLQILNDALCNVGDASAQAPYDATGGGAGQNVRLNMLDQRG